MKKLSIIGLLLLVLPAVLFAQEDGPFAVLEYFDNPDEVIITSSDGEDLYPDYGMELLPGDKIKTGNSVAEIRLDPNGSLIKLASNTEFVVDTLQDRAGAEANTFTLVTGKLKAIAARSGSEKYQIQTPSAVMGVRGTILGLESIPGLKDLALVEKGLATFTNLATGASVDLAGGSAADTFADIFEAINLSPDDIADFFGDIADFIGDNMNPDSVPGNQAPPPEVVDDTTVEDPEVPAEPEEPAEEVTEEDGGLLEPVLDWLRDVFGMELGTVTIGDTTYSKAVLQPTFGTGKFKLSLYLPIIYETNLFDPEDWYHPAGNDEWSFGTDYEEWETEPLGGVLDIFDDLFLKIRYIQYGEQRDKFYLKVGNLNNMTIGHGILMRDYANDADFPSIRRVGVNMGLDLGVFGFETVVSDLTEPEIMGARLYFRPLPDTFRLAFGLSGIVDIDPAGVIPEFLLDGTGNPNFANTGDPIFINTALDIDFPIFESEGFSFILFGDIAGLVPYYREPISGNGNTIEEGFYFEALIDAEADIPLRNYGLSAGAFGNIFVVDYRLEYRNFTGTFKPTLFGPNYDRLRGEYVLSLRDQLLDPQLLEPTMGIYGEAGFSIGDKFRFEAGYMWPWTEEGTSEEDYLHLQIELESGVVPVLDLHGSISYDRTKFIPTLLGGEGLSLFDANTTLSGELIYPVADMLDIAILVTTAQSLDEDGVAILDPDTGMPQIVPSISVETRVHF